MYVYMYNMPNRKNARYKQPALSSPTKNNSVYGLFFIALTHSVAQSTLFYELYVIFLQLQFYFLLLHL